MAKPFLGKLYQMVSDPTDNAVSWTPAGDALVVNDVETFAQVKLPLYFKHSNLSSFVRQLNTYGFKKIDPDRWAFAHAHFRRDAPDEVQLIQRKSSQRGGASAAGASRDEHVVASANEPSEEALRDELLEIKRHGAEMARSHLPPPTTPVLPALAETRARPRRPHESRG